MTSKPDLVLVNGSFHVPAHFELLVSVARARGITAHTLPLPTIHISPELKTAPEGGWPDHFADAGEITRVLRSLIIAQERNVIVYAHSYGGVPASEAVDIELTAHHRRIQGKKGGVLGMVFMGACITPPGISTFTWLMNEFQPCADHDSAGIMTAKTPEHFFFNDLPNAKQEHWSALLRTQPFAPYLSVVKNAGWMHVPCIYLIGTKDNTATPLMCNKLKALVRDMKAQMEFIEIESGHSPFLSCIDGVLGVADRFENSSN